MKNFDKSIWRREIQVILHEGLTQKFQQNSTLAEALLVTGDTYIVEANQYDREYGVGLSLTDSNIWLKEKWTGENLMGKALMAVRDHMKTVK